MKEDEADTRTWVIQGASMKKIIEEVDEIKDAPDARVVIRKHGNSITLQFYGTGYDGPPINDSSPCPGSPGCP